MEQQESDHIFENLPKKEASLLKKELNKLRRNLDGIKTMKGPPDIVIVVDQKRETTAIQEVRYIR